MHAKLVSIYIPTRNRSDLLARAVKSAVEQSYPHVEVIVVDDHSEPMEREKNRAVCSCYPNVTLLQNDAPKGANFARNRAIQFSAGEFVTGLDDDDEFAPTRVERMLAVYSTDVSFVCSASLIKSPSKTALQTPLPVLTAKNSCVINYVGNQILTEREKMLRIGGFDERLPSQQDHDMWLRLLKEFGPAVGLSDILQTVYWNHAKPQITGSSRATKGRIMFLAKHKRVMSRAGRRFYLYSTILGRRRAPGLETYFMMLYTYIYRGGAKVRRTFL